MKLSEFERDRISRAVARGAQMLVGRDHAGRIKLKVKRGLFGLVVDRYNCIDADLEDIRIRLKALSNKAA
jgi:hypothetical protein